MDQEAMHRVRIEFVAFQTVRMFGGVLERIFDAIDLEAKPLR
jgi:hypothetical protein